MQSDRQSLLIYPVRVFDRPRTDRIANQAGACSVALLVQVHERWPERPPETDAVPHSARDAARVIPVLYPEDSNARVEDWTGEPDGHLHAAAWLDKPATQAAR